MKIVIADDSQYFRQLLRKSVEKSRDHEVVGEAANGSAAILLLETVSSDILLLDIEMPVMNGIEVLRKLKDNNNAILVLLVSSYLDLSMIQQSLELGASGYILKDDVWNELLPALHYVDQKIDRPSYLSQSIRNEFGPLIYS